MSPLPSRTRSGVPPCPTWPVTVRRVYFPLPHAASLNVPARLASSGRSVRRGRGTPTSAGTISSPREICPGRVIVSMDGEAARCAMACSAFSSVGAKGKIARAGLPLPPRVWLRSALRPRFRPQRVLAGSCESRFCVPSFDETKDTTHATNMAADQSCAILFTWPGTSCGSLIVPIWLV
jgi:hypothetical protein